MSHTVRWLVVVWTLCIGMVAGAALAQTNNGNQIDYVQWQSLAERADAAIASEQTSNATFENIREALARNREAFLAASQRNSQRISTVEQQISALGPVPENGEEAEDIASRRQALKEQLQIARAPILEAEAAYSQADGLISEIDAVLAERRKQTLLTRTPSPLNPAHWASALEKLNEAPRKVFQEIARAWKSERSREEFRNNLPLVLFLFVLGTVLIVRSRNWVVRFVSYLRQFTVAGEGVWTVIVSLGRIVLPVLGIVLVSEALQATGLIGVNGTLLLDSLPIWGGILLTLRWLFERMFSKNDDEAVMPFPAEVRTELRLYSTLLALLFVLNEINTTLMGIANGTDLDQQITAFPILVIAALILFRLGQILVRSQKVATTSSVDTPSATVFFSFLKLFGRLSLLVAVSSPILGAFGFTNLAAAVLYPAIISLALFGLAVVIQRFLADLYGLLSGKGAAARDSLVSALIGFALAIGQLPFLALIWGVRPAELLEVWTLFREGFLIGGTRISPTNFITFIVIFIALYMLTRLFQSALKTSLLPKTNLDTGAQNAIVSGVGYLGIFLAALAAITGAGIDLSGLALLAGALSVGIGFGLQTIVQNFVSGIILLIERPIAEGDWIEVNGKMGYVRDISVRSTRIETFDRTDVIVPNAEFVSGTVTNYTRGNTVGRVIVPVGVAYGTDTHRVESILREIAEAHPMVLANPAPSVVFQGFGADSLDFEIRAILRDVNWMLSVKSDMNHQIAKRFVEEGIEIPYAQRDIWIRNPEALPGGGEGANG